MNTNKELKANVIADLEAELARMTPEQQEAPFFADVFGNVISPKNVLDEVKNDTDTGKRC